MPLHNHVTPFSEIVAVPERGTLMGNRGRIHNAQRELKKRYWDRKSWTTCLLQFKGRQRQVMGPSSYTELFFLDEVTALAAGHRPCAECRRADATRFKKLWIEVNGPMLEGKPGSMSNVDAVLHAERVDPNGAQRHWQASVRELPDVVMTLADEPGAAFLLRQGHLYRWSAAGYVERRAVSPEQIVTVLTPASLTRVLSAGYRPVVHSTVAALATAG